MILNEYVDKVYGKPFNKEKIVSNKSILIPDQNKK